MAATNEPTFPRESPAAIAYAASFALWISAALIRSPSDRRSPARSLTVDSPTTSAWGSTTTLEPTRARSSATRTVISFVMLAIGTRACASRDASTSPVEGLTTRYERPATGGGAGSAGSTSTSAATATTSKRLTADQRSAVLGDLLDADPLADYERIRAHVRIQRLQRRHRRAEPRGDSAERVAGLDDVEARPRLCRARARRRRAPRRRRGHRRCRDCRRGDGHRPRVVVGVAQRSPNEEEGDRDGKEKCCGRREPCTTRALSVAPLLPAGHGPDLVAQAGRLRGGGHAPVAAEAAVRVVERARDADERARRAARERARDVRGRGALRADSRQQEHLLRTEAPRLADCAGVRRADHEAEAREPALADELFAPLVRERGHLVPERTAVRQPQVLDVGAAHV